MNKKYDYLELVANFDKVQYRIYQTIIDNYNDFCDKLHFNITLNVKGCSQIFQDTKTQFIEYLQEDTDALEVSRLESYLISFIDRNKEFSEFYKDKPIIYSSVVNSTMRAFLNKTKTLKTNLNMLEMIYQNYIRYIHSDTGRSLIYDEEFKLENTPYYDENSETYINLNKCKKEVIKRTGIGLVSNIIVSSLWDEMLNGKGRINFKECERKVWEKFDKNKLPHSTLFLRMKLLYVQMLDNMIKFNLIDDYFDTSILFSIEGKTYNIKTAIEMWLQEAKIDYFYEKKSNLNRINYIDLVDGVQQFCRERGIKYTTRLENDNALIALKCDSDFNSHKSSKLYFYKNGVWKDYKTGKSGYLTQIIPKTYFS